MPTAEELKARFENRLRPGPTDERLAASLGLLPAVEPEPQSDDEPQPSAARTSTAAKRGPGNARPRRQPVRLVTPDDPDAPVPEAKNGMEAAEVAVAAQPDSGGVGLEVVGELFPPPPLLAAAGPEPVKVGFPVPVGLIRDVTRLKVDLSRQLGRRLSNHEIGTAASGLLPADAGTVADLVRANAERIGLTEPPAGRRRLVADIPRDVAAGLEDLVLAIDETEQVRITKSQLWALAHVLLLERAGR